MVQQRRIIDGGYSLEFPAGMLDYNLDDPILSAVEEVREELGINVEKDSMQMLSKTPFNVCESLMDEHVYIYRFFDENKILSHRLGSHQRYNS